MQSRLDVDGLMESLLLIHQKSAAKDKEIDIILPKEMVEYISDTPPEYTGNLCGGSISYGGLKINYTAK